MALSMPYVRHPVSLRTRSLVSFYGRPNPRYQRHRRSVPDDPRLNPSYLRFTWTDMYSYNEALFENPALQKFDIRLAESISHSACYN